MAAQSTDSCVLALISSFLNGLDVFRKLKKKRKKRGSGDDDESKLTRSLLRGPIDLREEYNKNYSLQGERFRAGDGLAHASLATLALKLNNGLVSIITSFLIGGKKNGKLDYKQLTTLSEASRRDAVDALSQLSSRLSQSSVSLVKPLAFHPKQPRKKADKAAKREKSDTGNIRRITLGNASAPQLAIIRPKARRSMSGSGSRSPPPPPPPQQQPKAHRRSQSAAAAPRRRASPPSPPPQLKGHPPSNRSTPNLLQHLHSRLQGPPPPPQQQQQPQPQSRPPTPPLLHPPPPTALGSLRRRRQARLTPSLYTFASDSTKLGEIPMHKWTTPFDFEAMARLNAEAALKPMPTGKMPAQKPRRGLFGLFRKSRGRPA